MTPPGSSGVPVETSLRRLLSLFGRHPRLSLTIVVALLGLPGLSSTPPIDRDEPEFAQPAREMLESRNFIDIRFQGAPLEEKPILTYWLQAGSAALFSGSEHNRIVAYRLPSLLAVWLAVLLTYELAVTLFGPLAAVSAAVLFASMPLVQSQAHQARADALLLVTVLGATFPLARVYTSHQPIRAPCSTPTAALFWVSLAASILVKGPVGPVLITLAAATLSLLEGDWHWLQGLQRWWAIPLFLVILLPWPVALYRSSGASFFIHAWQTDIFPKVISAEESHGAPPLAYALLAPLILWPGALLLPAAVQFAWRMRKDLPVRFCLALILPGWILFELAPTKLPHYVLPFVPMLSLLMAVCVDRHTDPTRSRMSSQVGAVMFVVAGLLIVGVIAAALMKLGTGLDTTSAAGIAILVAATIAVAVQAWTARLRRPEIAAAVCGMIASVMIFGVTLPRLQKLWIVDRAARVASIAKANLPVLVVGYREPSLVFLLGTQTRFVNEETAVAALGAGRSAVVIAASTARWELARRASSRVDLQEIARVAGIDPVHGRPMELGVWIKSRDERPELGN